MVNKVAIVGFSWGDHHNRTPWTPPWYRIYGTSK